MKIDIDFLRPFTGNLLKEVCNLVIGMRFYSAPQRREEEVIADVNAFLKTARATMFSALDEIENALDGMDGEHRKRFVFHLVEGFYPMAVVYKDWLLEWQERHAMERETDIEDYERQIIIDKKMAHKKMRKAFIRKKDSTPEQQCLYWLHFFAQAFGAKLSVLLREFNVNIDDVAELFPVCMAQQCDVYACAIFLCLPFEGKKKSDILDNFPILKNMVGEKIARKYIAFCEQIKYDVDKGRLLKSISDQRQWQKYSMTQIFYELKEGKILQGKERNFKNLDAHIDPNIITKFNKFSQE